MTGRSAVERIVELDRIVLPAAQTADVVGARRFLAQRKEAATGARVMILTPHKLWPAPRPVRVVERVVGRGGLEPPTSAVTGPERCA
jgi:hypothetical protein